MSALWVPCGACGGQGHFANGPMCPECGGDGGKSHRLPDPLRHHPRCEFWLANENDACTCGLVQPRPAWSTLEPVSEEAWREMVAKLTTGEQT